MPTTTEERRVARTLKVIEKHSTMSESVLLKLIAALFGLWSGFKHWDNPALVSGQAARSATIVDASLAQTRRLASSYTQTVLTDLDAAPKVMPKVEDIYPRSGTTELDVYSRPAEVYLYAISQGKTDEEALKMALARVKALAAMDTAAAERDAMATILAESPKVIGYRRSIHPELSRTGTCGLCMVAATQFYTLEELMPLHNECKCKTVPVTKDADPGLKLNEFDLKEIYNAAGSTAAADLKRTRVAVKENGELGPILVRDGQNFRDVKQVNRTGSGKKFTPYERPTIAMQRKSWAAMRDSSKASIEKLQEARSKGEASVDLSGSGRKYVVKDWDAAIRFHKELIDRMNARLR